MSPTQLETSKTNSNSGCWNEGGKRERERGGESREIKSWEIVGRGTSPVQETFVTIRTITLWAFRGGNGEAIKIAHLSQQPRKSSTKHNWKF